MRRRRRHRPDGRGRGAPAGAGHLLPLLRRSPAALARDAEHVAARARAPGGLRLRRRIWRRIWAPGLHRGRLQPRAAEAVGRDHDARAPSWGQLGRLHMLEIVGASLDGLATSGAVAACPNLTDLALLGCESSGSVNFALPLLQRCRLDFVGSGSSALMLAAPRVESLEVQGFSWIMLQGGDCLKRLIIAKNTGSVYSVGVDRLPVLEHLSLRGLQWSWGAVSYLLQCAAEVKHLLMKVEFCGDYDTLQPFPEVDLVEFFNTHPKLRKFEVHGAMFAALCQKNSLKNLDSRFSISSLEEVLITVRSPLNAEQKLITLESLLRYSPTVQGCVGWSSGSRR
ncbi:unnamed protein product [Alopecurus aequalis]